jgi:GTPase
MKSGFVILAGRSNVGKSTLLNSLVGTKVAIVTPKPQTTRQNIRGILHDPRGQAVFVDTPGVFDKGRDKLTEALNREIRSALDGSDLIVYVTDPTRAVGPEEHRVWNLIEGAKCPKIMVINKSDLPDREKPFIYEFRRIGEKCDAILEISALNETNLKALRDKIFELLPEGEPYYPEFQFSDMETKKWVEELIREKVFIQMHQEIPYSATVEVEEMERRPDKTLYIRANILTLDKRYKKMIIGKNAEKIKEIGQAARRELETAMQSKIYLDLEVEVDEHWIDRETHH